MREFGDVDPSEADVFNEHALAEKALSEDINGLSRELLADGEG